MELRQVAPRHAPTTVPTIIGACMLSLFLSALLVAHPTVPSAPAPDSGRSVLAWKIDPTHSELLFRIRHLVSRVTGTFSDWEGTITADGTNWRAGTVAVVIRTGSIDTNNERRDNHLRSPDFFDVARFPEMTFRSSSVTFTGADVTLSGELTIRDVTRPIVLTGTYHGISPGAKGRDRVGFAVSTTINRLDYGLKWNRAVEGGGMLLGDEVTIEATIEAVKEVGEGGE